LGLGILLGLAAFRAYRSLVGKLDERRALIAGADPKGFYDRRLLGGGDRESRIRTLWPYRKAFVNLPLSRRVMRLSYR
jgi:hypothetical protein